MMVTGTSEPVVQTLEVTKAEDIAAMLGLKVQTV